VPDLTAYDSLDEALMETFPASDPIAVGAVTPRSPEQGADIQEKHSASRTELDN
jgi:hypothetical protein